MTILLTARVYEPTGPAPRRGAVSEVLALVKPSDGVDRLGLRAERGDNTLFSEISV